MSIHKTSDHRSSLYYMMLTRITSRITSATQASLPSKLQLESLKADCQGWCSTWNAKSLAPYTSNIIKPTKLIKAHGNKKASAHSSKMLHTFEPCGCSCQMNSLLQCTRCFAYQGLAIDDHLPERGLTSLKSTKPCSKRDWGNIGVGIQ